MFRFLVRHLPAVLGLQFHHLPLVFLLLPLHLPLQQFDAFVTGGNLALMLPVITAGLALSVAVIKPLNLLLLGENYARTMGLNVQRTRTLLFLSTVLLAGTVTAFCGPVGFIGLAVPHLARMLFASADHRVLMPASMLSGAALLLVCDLISKSLALPINTVTALMGIPVVIVVVVRNRNLF